jgi:Polyketide cyclase / dehydrase and lipid transport
MNVARAEWPMSSILLFLFGIAIVFMGGFFIFIRPAMLPEDLRYLGASRAQLEAAAPALAIWLGHVFDVLGGYVTATGILTMGLAATAFRERRNGAVIAVAAAGAVSIGLMVVVNFSIASDFKWVLLAIASLWALSLVRYGAEVARASHDVGFSDPSEIARGYDRAYSQTVALDAHADEVFAFADDFTQLSSHMNTSSAMMMGSTMLTSFDEGRGQAIGSHVRMSGRMLGIDLFLDEVIREREPPRRKVWETVGTPRLLVIGGYRLGFDIAPTGPGVVLRVFIDYFLPASPWQRLLGHVLGGMYARWCVRQMVDGAAARFASPKA